MPWLRSLHLYSGLFLSLFLAALGLSGTVLLYKEDLWRLRYPELREPPAIITVEEHARSLDRIAQLFPGEAIRQVKFPRSGTPAYHVYLGDGEALVSQDGGRIIARWSRASDVLGFLTDLHINLFAGRPGRNIAGIIGLATALMALSGLVLWWPQRKRFSIRSVAPRRLHRASLLALHRDLGALASPLIVLFAVTGSGVVFYGASRALLNGMMGDPVPAVTPPVIAAEHPVGMADAAVIEVAATAVPGAQLMSYYPPAGASAVHYFRLRQHGEVHPNGRSMAFVNGNDGSLVAAVDATRQPPGERAAQWLYPLHSATIGGEPYRLVAAALGLALAVMAGTGPVTWWQFRRRRANASRHRKE